MVYFQQILANSNILPIMQLLSPIIIFILFTGGAAAGARNRIIGGHKISGRNRISGGDGVGGVGDSVGGGGDYGGGGGVNMICGGNRTSRTSSDCVPKPPTSMRY